MSCAYLRSCCNVAVVGAVQKSCCGSDSTKQVTSTAPPMASLSIPSREAGRRSNKLRKNRQTEG